MLPKFDEQARVPERRGFIPGEPDQDLRDMDITCWTVVTESGPISIGIAQDF